MRKQRRTAAAVAVGLSAIGLMATGCGGSDPSSAATAASSGGTSSAIVNARKALEASYAGTDRSLPKTGPKAEKGKTVWVLPCSSAAPGCAIPAAGAMEAGKAIGWNMKLLDGKADPSVYNQVLRSAIAAKVDAVAIVAIDCSTIKASIQAAKAAGVKVYGIYSIDCDDKYTGNGKALFDGAVSYGSLGKYANYVETSYAPVWADYVIAKAKPDAKIIELRENDVAIVRHINDGFDKAIKACAKCQVFTKVFTLQDLVTNKLQATTAAMLTQHPDATVVIAPYDATILLGVGAAVGQAQAQGRKVMLLGGEGFPPNLQLIKKGTQTMAVGAPGRWAGWAAIDGINRVFAGQPQVDPGIGHQTMDATHNANQGKAGYDGNPKSAGYDKNYLRIWGVGS